jgi:hypothetical protein
VNPPISTPYNFAVKSRTGLTGAEALAASSLVALATPILLSYLLDRMGLPFVPMGILPIAVLAPVITLFVLPTRAEWRWDEVAGYAAVVVPAFGWLAWRSGSWGLPVGSGDVTHHLLLVDYIERNWRLVHDPRVEAYLGEMVHYTPGLHILAALTGRWFATDGLHTIQTVVSATVALKAGFVYLVALRLLSGVVAPGTTRTARIGVAMLAAILLLLPRSYVLDSFLHDTFLAQVASEYFAVATWWAIVLWTSCHWSGAMALFALSGMATFLTWPIWVGPPIVALGLTLSSSFSPPLPTRVRHGLIAVGPIVLVAVLYTAGRAAQLGMARAEGAVLQPRASEFGMLLLGLAAAGALLAVRQWPGRVTTFLLAGVGLQAAALYVQSRAVGNTSAYMAFKTFYLFPYPLAVLAVLPLPMVWNAARWAARVWWRQIWLVRAGVAIVAIMTTAVGSYGAYRIHRRTRGPAYTKREVAPITQPMFLAGIWAREHLPPACIAYLVPDDDTSYWLHLAVLRNKRISARTADNATYDLGKTILAWYAPVGLPYAIADMDALTKDVRDELDVMARFGNAAVVKRRGPSRCDEEEEVVR